MFDSVGAHRRAWLAPLVLLFHVAGVTPAGADVDDVSAAYQRADLMQAHEHYRVFRNLRVYPHWISNDRFWYERQTDTGKQWMMVDAARGSRTVAFDHERLADALRKAVAGLRVPSKEAKRDLTHERSGTSLPPAPSVEIKADDLPLRRMVLSDAPRTARFAAFGKNWIYDIRRNQLTQVDDALPDPAWRVSPDGKWALFARDHNLWVKNLQSGEEKALTRDGEPFYAYGANPDATGRPAQKPEAIWSPDSKRVLTVQTDDRQVKELPMIDFAPENGVRPIAFARRTALPGDENITRFRILAIDVESGVQTRADHRDLPAVRMLDTPMSGNRAWWGIGGRIAYFVDVDRGERAARVIEFDTDTGRTRTLFSESAETYVELGSNVYMPASILPLPGTSELIWYSERSGWAHLYLYDLATGSLKRPITRGDWLVRDVLGVDAESRQVYISIAGRNPDKDPYYREIARVGLDDGSMEILSASDADHSVPTSNDFETVILAFRGQETESIHGLSPSREYLVETISRIDRLPRTVLRSVRGDEMMTVETATAPGLPKGWNWPEPVRLTAADGVTPISGVVFRPSDFSPGKKYPVIDYIYGGPQLSHVPETQAAPTFSTAQSLAELGFVVVTIDGRGTTERSRAFHEASHGAVHTASNLEDHIAGIRQLAARYPYMDLDRVGITGFSGGGYMTAAALLRFPEFFKVGVAGAGNHDQRLFWHSWGERYHGPRKGETYLVQANLSYAKNLQGKLLFIHGLLDYGVHPAGLFQLTQALMDANKKFDLVLMPRAGHELPGYAMVRMWDYFVEHLAGREPPVGFSANSASDYFREEAKAMEAENDGT